MQPARVTVRESITHQVMDGQDPTTFESRSSEWLRLKEQPYYRTRIVGTEWEEVDLAWLRSCSVLVIRNVWSQSYLPTPEQSAEASCRVIEVAFGGQSPSTDLRPALSIPAGGSTRLSNPMSKVWIRSRHKSETTVSIIAIPN